MLPPAFPARPSPHDRPETPDTAAERDAPDDTLSGGDAASSGADPDAVFAEAAPTGGAPAPSPGDPLPAMSGDGLSLEFDLPERLAGRFWRHPALPGRDGRPRAAAENLLWFDGGEAPLAPAGLLLERSGRGAARLVRIVPPGPAEPAETLRVLRDNEAPDEADGIAPVPIASFAGRCAAATVSVPGGTVEVRLRHGRLRSVASEAPVCRLTLRGPGPVVAALAMALADPLELRPCRATLPEAARALATGQPHRPRATGAADLSGVGTVIDAVQRTVAHLGAVLIELMPRAEPDAGPEAVHGLRVAARRLRSALRAFRGAADGPALRALDAGLRDLLRVLGPARDWDVFRDGLAAALLDAAGDEPRLALVLRDAEARRRAAYAALRAHMDGAEGVRLQAMLVVAAHGVPWRAEAVGEDPSAPATDAPLRAHAAKLLNKLWRRIRREGEEIEALPPEALHELRLSGKRLRYAAELFAPLWPGKASRRFLRRLAAVQEALGLANDVAVARGLATALATAPGAGRAAGATAGPRLWASGLIEGWALAGARNARSDALRAWKRLKRTSAFWDDAREA